MVYVFISVVLVVVIVWGFKVSSKKNKSVNSDISSSSYTPYSDITSGKVNSHQPIDMMDSKHNVRYEETFVRNKKNEK